MDHEEEGPLVMEMAVELSLGARTLRVRLALGSRVTALMGPSGAGKTSLLEVLAGLRSGVRGRIALGDVVWLDTNAGIHLPPNERRVGYVPQDAGLFPHLTVRRNVFFGARADKDAASAAIDMLEIRPLLDRHPVSLSGGERQRVAVARALALRPRLLLMDEPLASLDVALRGRILPYLIRIRDEWKVPCLYVTHSVGEALALAEHLVLLRDGAIEAEGRPGALLASPVVVEEAGAGLENLLDGRVVLHQEAGGTTSVALRGGMRLAIPLALEHAVGTGLTLAVRAEDVLVSNREIHGLSARNVFPAGITSLDHTGVDVTLRCAVGDATAAWLVRVTPAAVEALGLEPGSDVWLAVKSHSIRVV